MITYELGWLKSSNVPNKQDNAFMLHAILCFVFKIHACTGCIIPVVVVLILDWPRPSMSPIRWPLPVRFSRFWPIHLSVYVRVDLYERMKLWHRSFMNHQSPRQLLKRKSPCSEVSGHTAMEALSVSSLFFAQNSELTSNNSDFSDIFYLIIFIDHLV